MDSQIIISREDNTDFLSLGYIQTDTSLISALGGALTSFAEEIGLSTKKESATIKVPQKTINYSRFQNGVLASKMVEVEEHTPIILIAMRGFEGEDRELEFIVDYAELLAKNIVTKFNTEYSSIGIIPRLEQAIDIIINSANQMYKKSGDKVKYFTKTFKPKITALLDKVWANQVEFEAWAQSTIETKLSTLSQKEFLPILARYFYYQGTVEDALFPLYYSYTTNPVNDIIKLIDEYLNTKAQSSRNELNNEILKITSQLRDSSKALSARGAIEISNVNFINETFLFEKILTAKFPTMDKTVEELLSTTIKDLYKKLFKKYPLNFVSMSKENVFDISELQSLFKTSLSKILEDELKNVQWINVRIISILRNIISKYPPNEIMKKQQQIFDNVYDEFLTFAKKEHPFVILADPTLSKIAPLIRAQISQSFERYRTTLDEAIILYNVIGQTHSIVSNDKNQSTQDLMILYFLHSLIEPYQLRDVPDMVYSLIIDCLDNTQYGRKYNPSEIVEKSVSEFENKISFKINPETKKIVLNRISKAKPMLQKFENFENLSFFFKSFRSSLETTLNKILQTLFGPEKLPFAPNELLTMIEHFVTDVQNLFFIKLFLEKLANRPGAKELFSEDSTNFLSKNTKFKYIIPPPNALALEAIKNGWMKPIEKVSGQISESELKLMNVKIPSLNIEGQLTTLLTNTSVYANLLTKFSPSLIDNRQKELKQAIEDFEKQSKISAGDTSGKKHFAQILKKFRDLSKSLTSIISGGGLIRKFFGQKELNQINQEISKELYPRFTYPPSNFRENLRANHFSKIKLPHEVLTTDFQELMELYTSTWISDSNLIDSFENQIFWGNLMNHNNQNDNRTILEKKITQTLKSSYKKDALVGIQKNIIRTTIVEEIVPLFNDYIRHALAIPFSIFKNERCVEFDEKKDDWYISLGKLKLPPICLNTVFSLIPNVYIVKDKEENCEIRYLLSYLQTSKRSKEEQTPEVFLRKAFFTALTKREVKALDFFGNLNERYIGQSAADTFYSNIRSLAQIIITPLD